jgi:hypothetical protein
VAVWDARSREARAFFLTEVLGPLVAATRPADLRSSQAVTDAAAAWILCLKDVPADVLRRGVAALLASGPKWMPRPGDLREACAADILARRRAAAARGAEITGACPDCHGSTWREIFDVGGGSRGVARCACHGAALRLLEGVPGALSLPPAKDDGEAVA